MDQSTHAWLSVEAFKKLQRFSKTDKGKRYKTDGLLKLLGDNLKDVVVSSWLPDSMIKDMSYGHIFKKLCL